MPEAQPHLTPALLDAFLAGACQPPQADAIESHMAACGDCRVMMSTFVRARSDVQPGVTDPGLGKAGPVAQGERVAGKYRIERALGAGGMGMVYAAWHEQLNQKVALKFMLPRLASDPQAIARFQREARAASRLQSPHVGRVLDLDSLPDGTPFLVMELLDGESLDQRLARVGKVAPAEAVSWIQEALKALGEAHALGIVHRDFKPGNLFLARRPGGAETVKILDFGIAKSVHPDIEAGLARTSPQVLVGSPQYMSPEQLKCGAIEATTDVWAVGVVLYQMLSGRLPFAQGNLPDLMSAICNQPHRPLCELEPGVAPELGALVDRCLSKNSAQRPANAPELAAQLAWARKAGRRRPARRWPFALAAAAAFGIAAAVIALTHRAPVEPEPLFPPLPAIAHVDSPKAPAQLAPVAPPHQEAPKPAPAPVHFHVAKRARQTTHVDPATAPEPKAPPQDFIYGERR